jgi:hypothetical protein
MGLNFALARFPDVETMVSAMSASEDNQLAAMAAFLQSTKLDSSLRAHNWTTFARGYNGPNFAINHYDSRLNGEFQRFSTGSLPDPTARAVQLYLIYLGFHPGPVDGVPGALTLAALAQFQSQNNLPTSTTVDDDTVTQLLNALPPLNG